MDWPEIKQDTPLEEIKRIHQQIWQYVVENGDKPETPYGCTSCVLCHYVRLHSNDCRDCPAVWVNGQMDCNCFSKCENFGLRNDILYWVNRDGVVLVVGNIHDNSELLENSQNLS